MRRRLIFLAIGLCLLVPLLGYIESAMLFPGQFGDQVQSPPPDAEVGWLDSPEGRVEYWTLIGEGATADAPGPAVIYTHGNGERIDMWPSEMRPYRRLGVTVILAEFRGYGQSAGKPCEEAFAADLRSLRLALADDARIDMDRLVYHGRSLGGGALGTLIAEHPPRALILESTFRSFPKVAWDRMYVPSFLLRNRFDTEAALSHYAGPLLVMHGDRDQLIPTHHGEALARAPRPEGSPAPRLHIASSGHNDMLRGAVYWSAIESLLRDAGVLRD
ncbi:MAG: fermentation-respiration switch protein FrsA (DUF1100 family) [Polyangiales bacterium]|jgi:fermentation-respiration switch protein FrsA (DUF1100 family)